MLYCEVGIKINFFLYLFFNVYTIEQTAYLKENTFPPMYFVKIKLL